MLIVHKCLKGETPTYLADLIQYNYRRGGLRNNTDARKLLVLYVKNKTFASRAFSVYVPRMWNNLPITVREIGNTQGFKKALKTFLFKKAYNLDSDFIYY